MPKPWYSIKASAEGDVAEISILDAINSWYGVNAQSFLAEFRALKASKVKLYINSPGGSVVEALAMFNGMRATGKEIEVHILGIAASAASYIAMAGDRIVMPSNTLMFLHNPIGGAHGNAEELRDMADMLDKIGTMLTATYAKRFKGDEKALADLLSAESLLTAEECLAHGFCDEVTEEIAATASFDVESLPPAARKVFEAAASQTKPPAPTPNPQASPAPAPAPEAKAPLADEIAALAKDAGLDEFTAVFVTDPEAVSLEAAAKVIHTAREVKALAVIAGFPEQAEALIRDRKPLAEARKVLCQVRADKDAETRVDTAPRSKQVAQSAAGADADVSPTSLWAVVHEMKGKQ